MIDYLIQTFVVLFLVVDPIGNAPLFAVLSSEMDASARRRTALRAVILAAGMLGLFAIGGATLLAWLSIEIGAFRIAGGVLLFVVAVDMMFAHSDSGLRTTTLQERAEAAARPDISVFPLAFPLLAGPGALVSVLLPASQATGALALAGLLLIVVLVLICALAALLAAGPIMRLLGHTGVNVVTRLLGLLLAALAVQYAVDGIRELFL